MTPDYSVIIPAYNEEDFLPVTLASVGAAMEEVGEFTGEVIVVDNNSTDRTAELAAQAGARVVFEEHRQIARARNAGGAAARGRYLIFVDADTRISPALLKGSLRALDSGVFCGGGAGLAFDRGPSADVRFLLGLWKVISRFCRWAAGSYVFCRRDAFLEVDGFDERFYASEEIHFSQALKGWGRRHGFRMAILDEQAVTSLRKLDWFSSMHLARSFLRLGLNRSLLLSREGCRMWYERPGRSSPPPPGT